MDFMEQAGGSDFLTDLQKKTKQREHIAKENKIKTTSSRAKPNKDKMKTESKKDQMKQHEDKIRSSKPT